MSITQPYIDKGRIVEALRKYGTGPAYGFRADGLDIAWQGYLADGMGKWAEANGFTLNPYVAHVMSVLIVAWAIALAVIAPRAVSANERWHANEGQQR